MGKILYGKSKDLFIKEFDVEERSIIYLSFDGNQQVICYVDGEYYNSFDYELMKKYE